MSQQLPLGVRLRDDASFENFSPGSNTIALRALEGFLADQNEQQIYLWGASGSGKSHLAQALCHQASERGILAVYFPLAEPDQLHPSMCEGLERYGLICLDDIQCVSGSEAWQYALFHLYNRMRDQGGKLLVTADQPPAQLGITLPDLVSRLTWGVIIALQELSEAEKVIALQLRARQRGLSLSDEVASYLLRRCPRDMAVLYAMLEQLDQASLAAKRALTIPFVRDVLARLQR